MDASDFTLQSSSSDVRLITRSSNELIVVTVQRNSIIVDRSMNGRRNGARYLRNAENLFP